MTRMNLVEFVPAATSTVAGGDSSVSGAVVRADGGNSQRWWRNAAGQLDAVPAFRLKSSTFLRNGTSGGTDPVASVLLLMAPEGERMRSRVAIFAVASLFAAFMSTPAQALGQQSSPQHEEHHPATTQAAPSTASEAQANMMNMMARMNAMDTKLDELVKKMNASKGPAKTDAMAELLTALVEDRRSMHEAMMANMMSMMGNMNMMGGRGGHTEPAPMPPKK